MIRKKRNSLVVNPSVFDQLEVKTLFPFDLMKKKIVGYVSITSLIWIIYDEEGEFIKVPFARNKKWFDAITSEPEFSALKQLKRIYIV